MQRRDFLGRTMTLLLVAGAGASFGAQALAAATPRSAGDEDALRESLRKLEQRSGGRLGVSVLDTGDGRHWSARGDERFPMCSTYKLPLVAAVLRKAELGEIDLNARVAVPQAALVSYSPVTEPLARAGRDASVAQLCEASIALSDNTAANLLLPLVGDPAGLNRFLRGIGDAVTAMQRTPGAPLRGGSLSDTTTPNAMLATMRSVLLGEALNEASRRRLTDWLVASKTGPSRLRAGLPKDWRVGHKTGSSDGIANDVAIVWPPRRKPVLIAGYLRDAWGDDELRSSVLADAARTLAAHWIDAA
ncbi:class A beta-lactamase [Lysobacter sp. K5869]|uniref:class A beta-lactamase n=1 Tax=Lysobacter sp. K5869 TaxID=2820808 RepID=UPI001C05F851|nr:class A beta-lactamase [Lysobacter sp. K5869]QWP78379.1 class A beta-lactamase [Lysobacter sp. K5869]